MSTHLLEIKVATTPGHYADAKTLIMEYVQWLGMDLSFQNFENEMLSLPDMYNINDGGLFLAYLNGHGVGIVGLRRLSETDGEVKRMFVQEIARGYGVGKQLLLRCIAAARHLHYHALKLDTVDYMTAAIRLYKDHGFVEIPAYRFNPHEQAKYFALALGTG